MSEQWRLDLRSFRLRRRLSQAKLAEAAGVSVIAIKSYEGGARRPSKATLEAIVSALEVPRLDANRIRREAGYHAESYLNPDDDYWFTPEELEAEVRAYPWPVFVLKEGMELLLANRPAERMWGVDLSREFLEPGSRSLLAVASDERFASQAQNWDEIMRFMVGLLKRDPAIRSLDDSPVWLRQAVEQFVKGNPAYVGPLLRAWETVKPLPNKLRTRYGVEWLYKGAKPITFLATVTTAHFPDQLAWNEWVPADAASWVALETIMAEKPA